MGLCREEGGGISLQLIVSVAIVLVKSKKFDSKSLFRTIDIQLSKSTSMYRCLWSVPSVFD